MHRIKESEPREIIGESGTKIVKLINGLIDYSQRDSEKERDKMSFFNINGTVLLYGLPGVGKTTIAQNCMHYALEKYGVESYRMEPSEIIVPELGKSVSNLKSQLDEFKDKESGILFIDEIDRFCVNRKEDEVSELKRMLIELMQMIDDICFPSKKIIISCTNVFDQLDPALKRRFSIVEEVKEPSKEDKKLFIQECLRMVGQTGDCSIKNRAVDKFVTIDDIIRSFRHAILTNSISQFVESLKERD